jgi:hypothetical protein
MMNEKRQAEQAVAEANARLARASQAEDERLAQEARLRDANRREKLESLTWRYNDLESEREGLLHAMHEELVHLGGGAEVRFGRDKVLWTATSGPQYHELLLPARLGGV